MAFFDGCKVTEEQESIPFIETENTSQKVDEFFQNSDCVENTQTEKVSNLKDPDSNFNQKIGINYGILMKMVGDESSESSIDDLFTDVSFLDQVSTGRRCNKKLSLIEVTTLFENYVKTGESILDLQGRLMSDVEWLPLSLVKLSNLTEIDISKNEIMALPANIGELKGLKKFDINSNQLINLPSSIGEISSLIELNLHGNRLKSLPSSFEKLLGLINLDLSANLFHQLPDSIGKLISLKRLDLERNELEEIPSGIGSCISLVVLNLDFNRLKSLPSMIGDLENLGFLTLRYNRVVNLPESMCNLQNLEELNLSFNELKSIPDSLCSMNSLKKLNIGNNFVDLTSLPNSIGNLVSLEELDISYDQIFVLPDSFRLLSKLKIFIADETPLEVPPREIIELGAQAVVQYMVELVDKRNNISNRIMKERRGLWSSILSCFCLDEVLRM